MNEMTKMTAMSMRLHSTKSEIAYVATMWSNPSMVHDVANIMPLHSMLMPTNQCSILVIRSRQR